MLLCGLLFAGQNLYRKQRNNNRLASIRAGEYTLARHTGPHVKMEWLVVCATWLASCVYASEEAITNNMRYTSLDTLSMVLRGTFGFLDIPHETQWYE